MFTKIKDLSNHISVSGCETMLIEYIRALLEEKGISAFVENECLIVIKSGKKKDKKKIFVSAGVDLPGFICLTTDERKAYLSKTGSFSLDEKCFPRLVDEFGKIHLLKKLSDDGSDYYTSKNNLKYGDVLGVKSRLLNENEKISGHFAGRYALIALLLSVAEHFFENDVIFSFTASSLTAACRENLLIRRFQPDRVILLGQSESASELPILLMKDGKAFGDRLVSDGLEKRLSSFGASFEVKLSASAVTKAESIYSRFDLPIHPVLLPVERQGKKDEAVSVKSIENTLFLLQCLLNQ